MVIVDISRSGCGGTVFEAGPGLEAGEAGVAGLRRETNWSFVMGWFAANAAEEKDNDMCNGGGAASSLKWGVDRGVEKQVYKCG